MRLPTLYICTYNEHSKNAESLFVYRYCMSVPSALTALASRAASNEGGGSECYT